MRAGTAGTGKIERVWIVALVLTIAFIVWFWIEPRMVWPGFLGLLALMTLATNLFATMTRTPDLGNLAPYLGAGIVLFTTLAAYSPALVGIFLLVNFFIMWRKEGLGARLTKLSGVVGLLLLGYFAVFTLTFMSNDENLIALTMASAFPLIAIALGFIAFVLYANFFQWFFKRFGGPVNAVVVLGAYVRDGKVTPLLAKRIDQGIALLARGAEGAEIPLVMSGGQGGDELVAEADAMADYALERGVSAQVLRRETESATTEENLKFSKALLDAEGITGDVAVATNDYHAFRAATMMRRAGLPGYTVGCPTARYFWPSAMIREYVALLRDHFWFVVAMLGLSILPIILVTIGILQGR